MHIPFETRKGQNPRLPQIYRSPLRVGDFARPAITILYSLTMKGSAVEK